jgi:CRP-like cAMP-binding protein
VLVKGEIVMWNANETVYHVGDNGSEAYLILEGVVDILTNDGLRLNRLGVNEIFGESSLLLGAKRSVTVVAGKAGAQARRIPKSYFDDVKRKDIVMAAIIRKTQLRLIASNDQSSALSKELEELSNALEKALASVAPQTIDPEIKARLVELRQKIESSHIDVD